ncbi:MAG: hypothetical protein F6J90_07375 [Moorea sp. SIOASIH]|uniref:SGNH/GDSL hydrolase family protein n=1 Tax=Moorena sp. SIOASIH TaxID=2607817 RepID=UPI0013BC28DE|nr:GDSL-type esterase/lipase family protein [Moorena sp. SIOASIH]NEO36154.1 hypothetical protein [Moorena sp. SIOASIH]
MAPVKKTKKPFGYGIILFPWLGLILVSPILGTLAINKYPRNAILETWSHWLSEQRNATAVFCGDSLAAGGGHWGPRVGLGYFTTRNLAGNGYTIRQTISQVKKANIYQPKWIIVAAGTNDAFSILDERQTIEDSILDFSKLINSTQSSLILTLPPPTRRPEVNDILMKLRKEMIRVAQSSNLQIIDSWSEFIDDEGLLKKEMTTDGVHLTDKAYEIWSQKIQIQML